MNTKAGSVGGSSTPPLVIDRKAVSDPQLFAVLNKLIHGQRLQRDDGLALMASRDLTGLGTLAHSVRSAIFGRAAFYVVNQHLNYTNICTNHCAFCAYRREEGQEGAFLLSPQQAADRVREAPGPGADELHIVGGCHPDLDLNYYIDLLQALGQVRPQATIKAFTAVEIDHIAHTSRLEPTEVIAKLRAAGLQAMPGGGAEIFSQRVRDKLCPDKADAERWLAISGEAHSQGVVTNATMLYGHIETPEERVDHLLALREQQDKTGGFNAFIPLAYHPKNTELGGEKDTTGLDDLRVIATARLLLDNFPHIKAYWVMLGPKLAQVALNFGADDLDGTIVEERITHSAGATTATGLTEPALRSMIRAAGFDPVRRDGAYNSLEDRP